MKIHRAAFSAAALALFALSTAPALAQDWRGGSGHLDGFVQDMDGKPIVGASVKLELPKRGGTELKTDKKGHWGILSLSPGMWNIDIAAEGYVPKSLSAPVGDESRIPPVVAKLEKAKPTGPSPEIVAASKKAEDAYNAGNFDEARAAYQELLKMRPDLAPRIHERIGYTYIQQKEFAKGVEELKQVLAVEPGNNQVRALAGQAALEGKMIDDGRAILKDLDETGIKDPDIFFNIGVDFLNAGSNEDAVSYFTKAVNLNPDYADGYYRRGLAYLSLNKMAECKADFQKVLQLTPTGPQADMVRKALEQLK
jgi:tetratricopeptide (TPR) repeat protein